MEDVALPPTLADYYVGFPVNSTSIPHPFSRGWAVTLCLSLSIIIGAAVVGNMLVITTVLRHPSSRASRTNIFILSLAVADILVALLDMPISALTVSQGIWILGSAMCQLDGFTMAVFLIASIHTLMYIAVHKYVSVCHPFSRFMTHKKCVIFCSFGWTWALICGITLLVGWNDIVYKLGTTQCGPNYPSSISSKLHSFFISLTCYLLPVSVLAFCYISIFRKMRHHGVRMARNSNERAQAIMEQQRRISQTMFIVVACFLLCWTPYVIYSNYIVFSKDKGENIKPFYSALAWWCGYLNSACNPIIYALRSESFRQSYIDIICGCRRKRNPSQCYSGNGLDLTIQDQSPTIWRKTTTKIRKILRSTSRPTAGAEACSSMSGGADDGAVTPTTHNLHKLDNSSGSEIRPRLMTAPANISMDRANVLGKAVRKENNISEESNLLKPVEIEVPVIQEMTDEEVIGMLEVPIVQQDDEEGENVTRHITNATDDEKMSCQQLNISSGSMKENDSIFLEPMTINIITD